MFTNANNIIKKYVNIADAVNTTNNFLLVLNEEKTEYSIKRIFCL